jgi:hypothetical protein
MGQVQMGRFDISFIAINHKEGKLGAFASLLLTNQLRVIQADTKVKQGNIAQPTFE